MKTNVKQKPAATLPNSMPVDIEGVEYQVMILPAASFRTHPIYGQDLNRVRHDVREIHLNAKMPPNQRIGVLREIVDSIRHLLLVPVALSN